MRRTEKVAVGGLAAVTATLGALGHATLAFAHSEGGDAAGAYSGFSANIGLYVSLIGFAAVSVALGIFILWCSARWTRMNAPADQERDDPRP